MAEILRQTISGEPHRLVQPRPRLDAVTARHVDELVTEAEARGRRAGEAAGAGAARVAAQRAATAVIARLDDVAEALGAHRRELTAASTELARRVCDAVLARTPPDEASAVLGRVQEAVAALDEEAIEVRLNPDDHAVLGEAVLADRRLALVADGAVARGDAVLAGRHAGVDLTRAALVEAALAVVARVEEDVD